MRISAKKNNDRDNQDAQDNQNNQNGDPKKTAQQLVEEKLVEAIKNSMEKKREEDEEFDNIYGNLRPELLVKEIKFYVNKPEDFVDIERAELEAVYLGQNIQPKHAPLTSIDEMYMLLGWPDDMIELIKDRLTVHEVSIIPANEITEDQLKLVFPNITEELSADFFKLRDGDPEKNIEPEEFYTQEDFKNAILRLGIASSSEFDERMKELEIAGLKIGTAGKLFRVEAVGEYERATHRLIAFIDLPIKPQPPKKKKKDKNKKDGQSVINDGSVVTNPNEDEENPDDPNDDRPNDPNEDKKEKEPPTELLEPRIIELRVN